MRMIWVSYLHISMCTKCMPGVLRGQKGVSDPLLLSAEPSLQPHPPCWSLPLDTGVINIVPGTMPSFLHGHWGQTKWLHSNHSTLSVSPTHFLLSGAKGCLSVSVSSLPTDWSLTPMPSLLSINPLLTLQTKDNFFLLWTWEYLGCFLVLGLCPLLRCISPHTVNVIKVPSKGLVFNNDSLKQCVNRCRNANPERSVAPPPVRPSISALPRRLQVKKVSTTDSGKERGACTEARGWLCLERTRLRENYYTWHRLPCKNNNN